MEHSSLLAQLDVQCEQAPDVPAIVDAGGGTLSRRQLLQRARALARGFAAAGLRPGDTVLFAVRPDARALVLMIAIAEAGGVLVPLDSTMGPALFASRMHLLAPRWVVVESMLLAASSSPWMLRVLAGLGRSLPAIAQVQGARFVRVGPAWPAGRRGLSLRALEQLGSNPGTANHADRKGTDAAMMVFTSGTTGAPKVVVHSWASMHAVFDLVGSLLNAGPGDRVHARELHLILPALNAGATVIVPRRGAFSTTRMLRDLEAFQVTHLFGIAAECQQLLDRLRSRGSTLPHSLREIWIGAAPVHAAFLEDFQAVLPCEAEVWCVYGMTEILPVSRISLADKLRYEGEGDLVGECVPGVRARLSQDGELMLSGPNLFAGYFGEPGCSEHATGDIARLDGGRIVLLGRRKDMIIRRRFNVYPELYEPAIERIEGVRRCAMVGVYDATLADERIILAVEPDAGVEPVSLENRLWRELRGGSHRIDAAALPDRIVLMTLPQSGRSSKVDKQRLRELAARMMA